MHHAYLQQPYSKWEAHSKGKKLLIKFKSVEQSLQLDGP